MAAQSVQLDERKFAEEAAAATQSAEVPSATHHWPATKVARMIAIIPVEEQQRWDRNRLLCTHM